MPDAMCTEGHRLNYLASQLRATAEAFARLAQSVGRARDAAARFNAAALISDEPLLANPER